MRDLAIQPRENDLIVATFGRGFYILDDYTPLRAPLTSDATLFPVKKSNIYIEALPLANRGKSWQGESFYTADNPPFGALFTYFLKDTARTMKEQRNETERNLVREKKDPPYPSQQQLRAEAAEEAPAILLTISDSAGHVIRRLTAPATRGFHRIAWDLRMTGATLPPPRAADADDDVFPRSPQAPFVAPGLYQVALARRINGVVTPLGQPQKFQVDGPATLKPLSEFLTGVVKLQRSLTAANEAVTAARVRTTAILRAIDNSAADLKLRDEAMRIDRNLKAVQEALTGDKALSDRYENLPPSIQTRVSNINSNYRMFTGAPHKTDLDSYKIATDELSGHLKTLRQAIDVDLKKLDRGLDAAGVPHTPGRL